MAYTKEQAWELLTQYNKGEFHLKHANTVADVMRWYAEKLGYGDEADFWEIVAFSTTLILRRIPTSTASSRRRSCVKTVSTSA